LDQRAEVLALSHRLAEHVLQLIVGQTRGADTMRETRGQFCCVSAPGAEHAGQGHAVTRGRCWVWR
jgi:hypothetical protein